MRASANLVTSVLFGLLAGCGAAYPEVVAVNVFPTEGELSSLRAPVSGARPITSVSTNGEVTFESPPEFGAGNASVDDGPVARSLGEIAGARVVSTTGMACAAQTLARYFLREDALPTDPVLAFVLGRCGVSSADPEVAVHTYGISEPIVDGSIPSGAEHVADELRAVTRRSIPFAVEVGSAFSASDERVVWLALAAPRRATLSASRLEDDRYLVSGRLENERFRAVEAWVNLGEYGVARCAREGSARLPDFRLRCPMNPHDATARVDLVAIPRQSLMPRRAATLLLHRDDQASLAHRPRPEIPQAATEGDLVTQLVNALAAAREEAGQDALVFTPVESARQGRHAPALFAAVDAGDAELTEQLSLGLLAGWDSEAAIVRGELLREVGRERDARSFVRDRLDTPFARRLLLSADVDLVAVTAEESEAGIRATFTLFQTWDEEDLPDFARAWNARVTEARAANGLTPFDILADVQDLQQEADKVTRREVHPREALDDAMARLRGRLGATVRGWQVEASDPRWVELPTELLMPMAVRAVTGVAWHRPDGAAWGQLVLFVCVFPD